MSTKNGIKRPSENNESHHFVTINIAAPHTSTASPYLYKVENIGKTLIVHKNVIHKITSINISGGTF